jgi:hypothetical protein
MLPINFSTHFSSASEVVACHRYKQLNYSIIVSQESRHIYVDIILSSTLQTFPRRRSKSLWSKPRSSWELIISYTGREWLGKPRTLKAPGAALANEAENAANVVRKDGTSEPSAIDETRRLKDLLFLSGDFLLALRVLQGDIIWVLPRTTLINLNQFVRDVLNVTINNGENIITRSRTYVVIAAEQHEQNADGGRKQEKTIFGKCVRIE